MRLVKAGTVRRATNQGRDTFEQLRDAGDRLQHVVGRYGRLVSQFAERGSAPDMLDTIELMNSQLAYVARRLQEMIVAEYEEREDESRRYRRAIG